MLKQGIIAIVIPPVEPGSYTRNTNALKYIYKQELQRYKEYEEHKRNIIKIIAECFYQDFLVDLKN